MRTRIWSRGAWAAKHEEVGSIVSDAELTTGRTNTESITIGGIRRTEKYGYLARRRLEIVLRWASVRVVEGWLP